MVETVKIETGDWVEVWNPRGDFCVAWGRIEKDPDPQPLESHRVVMVKASFDARFPVDKCVRFPFECLQKVEMQ